LLHGDYDDVMRPGDLERYMAAAREAQRAVPNADQLRRLQEQTKAMLDWANDPAAMEGRREFIRLWNEPNDRLSGMGPIAYPDQRTWEAIQAAISYVNSDAFRAQRDAILLAAETARQRLGEAGLAAAGRVASRHAARRLEADAQRDPLDPAQAAERLAEAAELAASTEVLEAVQRAPIPRPSRGWTKNCAPREVRLDPGPSDRESFP